MDGKRVDQIARALAGGMSRRGALKGIAVALGFAGAGMLTAPAAAAPPWCACTYLCGDAGAGGIIQVCSHHCRSKLPGRHGQIECTLATSPCGFSSEEACYESFPL
jgi:hypothetical protein